MLVDPGVMQRLIPGETEFETVQLSLSDEDGCGIQLRVFGQNSLCSTWMSICRVYHFTGILVEAIEGSWNLLATASMTVNELPNEDPCHVEYARAYEDAVAMGRFHYLDDWPPNEDDAHGLETLSAQYKERGGKTPVVGFVAILVSFGPPKSQEPYTRNSCDLPEHLGSRVNQEHGAWKCGWGIPGHEHGHDCGVIAIWQIQLVMACHLGCVAMCLEGPEADVLMGTTDPRWHDKPADEKLSVSRALRASLLGRVYRIWVKLGREREDGPILRIVRIQETSFDHDGAAGIAAARHAMCCGIPDQDLLNAEAKWALPPLREP
jgi:hypothetical protein